MAKHIYDSASRTTNEEMMIVSGGCNMYLRNCREPLTQSLSGALSESRSPSGTARYLHTALIDCGPQRFVGGFLSMRICRSASRSAHQGR